MMIDYHVSDHWPANEPAWTKSLVSSLNRRSPRQPELPLTTCVEEIRSWIEFASGDEAWSSRANRDSLLLDLDESARAIGRHLRGVIATQINAFRVSFIGLITAPREVRRQPAGQRTDAVWVSARETARILLEHLDSREAVAACWDDLVSAARSGSSAKGEHRAIAELLHDQIRRRGLEPDHTFSNLVGMVAYGNQPDELPLAKNELRDPEQREADAKAIACATAPTTDVVVWLGYQGPVSTRLESGRVFIIDAHWAVPNTRDGGQLFPHRDELANLVGRGGLFEVRERVDEQSSADFLVRIDLGRTHTAGALKRAQEVAETILDVSLYYGGGVRPHLAEGVVVADGRAQTTISMALRRETGFPDDRYGGHMTAESISEFGPAIANALAAGQLPLYLRAALEVKMAADRPFSRDYALREPSEADITSVIPLADRVVEHIAAHAGLAPDETFRLLKQRWSHSHWLAEIRRAVHLCLIGGTRDGSLKDELVREWYNPTQPWILFAADRRADLLSICLIESERAWIERILYSISNHSTYAELIAEFEAQGDMLEARRQRIRNGLVHGNPAAFAAIASVREYSDFVSGCALHIGLESFIRAQDPATDLSTRTPEFVAMQRGVDAATFWRKSLEAD